MKVPRRFWRPGWLGIIVMLIVGIVLVLVYPISRKKPPVPVNNVAKDWPMPDTAALKYLKGGELIRYGRDLITHTAQYLGPKGTVKQISNGMNCQNCHMSAGTVYMGNSFLGVTSSYPKYRDRSGMVESIEFRINECMERSLNGEKLDSSSREMRAMLAYFAWMGQNVPKGKKIAGTATEELSFLGRPADAKRGKSVYIANCQSCHGVNGEGLFSADSASFIYPPLWGENSYTVSAGMYRLTKLAGFIRNNMPLGTTWKKPLLSVEDSWDVAAYISSGKHPERFFASDWPNISSKPVDYPYGPYTDGFSESQHKFGPFGAIKNKKLKK